MKVITLSQLLCYLNDVMGVGHMITNVQNVLEVSCCGTIVGHIPTNLVRDLYSENPYMPLRGVVLTLYGQRITADTLQGYTYVLD